MSIKEFLKIFDLHKLWTYGILFIVLLLIYEVNWKWVVAHKLPNVISTTLTSAELLVVAGLTITFYTLLLQVIDRTLGKDKKYEIIESISTTLILLNIFLVSITIILILISSLGADSLRLTGFYYLINSWVYNVIIMFFVIVSPFMERLLVKKTDRIIINLSLIILLVYSVVKFLFFTI
ncbi:hypothetical protein [Methanobacterium spitsbergense]|uniref:Yip1 domain-containing protein n=1 Tax=Methanobacterium spitsbergense TaxID=2874285 RepID=A0A8T5V0K3_9EURY|nr:hypothetical protein [Methanobacterium spitsbergense]MBZ2165215.1 hypothetical protein [Methanobacterium spitsbergense]